MNIHPIFVHFPIAFMTIYALLELLRFRKLKQNETFLYIKASFVIIGTISAFAALATGEMIEDMFESGPLGNVVEAHSFFASLSTAIFGLMAFFYLLLVLDRQKVFQKTANTFFKKPFDILLNIAHYVTYSPLSIIIALIGLVAITITGALGGAMVHGPEIDPLVSFIYHIIFK